MEPSTDANLCKLTPKQAQIMMQLMAAFVAASETTTAPAPTPLPEPTMALPQLTPPQPEPTPPAPRIALPQLTPSLPQPTMALPVSPPRAAPPIDKSVDELLFSLPIHQEPIVRGDYVFLRLRLDVHDRVLHCISATHKQRVAAAMFQRKKSGLPLDDYKPQHQCPKLTYI